LAESDFTAAPISYEQWLLKGKIFKKKGNTFLDHRKILNYAACLMCFYSAFSTCQDYSQIEETHQTMDELIKYTFEKCSKQDGYSELFITL
jgi:hypothetical protein